MSSVKARISLAASMKDNIIGESHLSLCHAICVYTSKLGNDQGRATSSPRSTSTSVTILGRKAIPIPEIAHCLMASALWNSKEEILSMSPFLNVW